MGEKTTPKSEPASKAAISAMLITVAQTAFLTWFAYNLTGKVDLSLKDRQTTVASVKQMDGLIEGMLTSGDADSHLALARRIAMYGSDAVEPLLYLAIRSPGGVAAPIFGLQLLSIKHRDEVCLALRNAERVPTKKDRRDEIEKLARELEC